MNAKHFIVLSGEGGAGKDSVAKILVAEHGYMLFSLSDEMKTFAGRVFGWTDEQLRGPSHLRNVPDPRWARPCHACNGTGCDVRWSSPKPCPVCSGEGSFNDNSPRRILQLLGDEWGRQMIHPDIWTMSTRNSIEEKLVIGQRIVINDARFSNDRNNLAEWFGAKRVDVRTNRERKSKNADWRKHGSENDRPTDDQVDYVLHNDEEFPFPSLPMLVTVMLGTLYGETREARNVR